MLICRLHVGGVCETWFTPSLHRGLYRNRGIERAETESEMEFGWGAPPFPNMERLRQRGTVTQ